MKPVNRFFVYRCIIVKSCVTLGYSDMFINKLKTKLHVNSFFTKWFQIQKEFTTPFEDISP